ncbi:conserved hypothetical protein [Talaromyces stipitatus ATCC 10500]|uniref:Ubiquitin conjugating enzyme n=1 Tax=Talaromyces stipitatus (strain ATCC 10500 / CBS 375.48 / QM 6759 / NRRL 1006) TaxID=441959 RepID=B8LW00_TALSN|nr:uncharacterized protein TSTA_077320 [Talaromyces stipitatus ATCC 10500]EED24366.1 conserved hypothetical protein [Talaromyces stipitatus ATCC 10500]
MSALTSVLIRRGTELISARLQYREQPQTHGLPGFLTVVFTVVAFGLAIFWVDYTCTHVIATLAAVEDSHPTSYIRLEGEDSNDTFNGNNTAKPITSGLRSAINYLRARGGIWSCFRGFRMYLAFTGLDFGAGLLISAIGPIQIAYPIRSLFGGFVTSMLLVTWQMAWIHLVIADKSPRRSFRRMLGLQHWPRIAPAAALYNFLTCVTLSAATASWTAMSLVSSGFKGRLGLLATSIISAVFFLLLSIPARAIFTRVAASMLPEEDEQIVPFDRHFNGKAKPEIVGGSGKLSIRDAWATFEWAARIRYVKIILKAFAIEFALAVVGILLVVGELALLNPSRATPRQS